MMYAAETWNYTNTDTEPVQAFENTCFRTMIGFRYPRIISNMDLWKRLESHKVTQIITTLYDNTLKWYGHVVRMPENREPAKLMFSTIADAKRPNGKPSHRFRDTVKNVMAPHLDLLRVSTHENQQQKWKELAPAATNRQQYKQLRYAIKQRSTKNFIWKSKDKQPPKSPDTCHNIQRDILKAEPTEKQETEEASPQIADEDGYYSADEGLITKPLAVSYIPQEVARYTANLRILISEYSPFRCLIENCIKPDQTFQDIGSATRHVRSCLQPTFRDKVFCPNTNCKTPKKLFARCRLQHHFKACKGTPLE